MVSATLAPVVPPCPSASLAVVGFTQVPNTVLMDTTLSRDARFLYTLLLQHARARTGYVVRVGYARLCDLMDAGEDLVRRAMAALAAAGLVEQTRRGCGRVNTYRLRVTAPLRTRAVRDAEPGENGFSLEEHDGEEHGHLFENSSATSPVHFVDTPCPAPAPVTALTPPSTSPPPPPPCPRALPDPPHDAVTTLVGDLRRELGDRATLGSTVSRAHNLWRTSGATWEEFTTAVYSARAATQARTGAIRDRDAGGTHKVGYFFAVLADRLGMRAAPAVPPASAFTPTAGEPTIPIPSTPVPRAAPPLPPLETGEGKRAAFWERLRTATGIGDLVAYCHACGRPPVYDDLARSVQIVRERRCR